MVEPDTFLCLSLLTSLAGGNGKETIDTMRVHVFFLIKYAHADKKHWNEKDTT